MPYLIGTDEAGYGPNFGPLVISASVWEVPDGLAADDMYEALAGVIVATPERSSRGRSPCMVIADSKVIYQHGKGLAALERNVLSALRLLGHAPATWQGVWECVGCQSPAACQGVPWYAQFDCPIPLEADLAHVQLLADGVERGLRAAGVRLVALASRVIFEAEFNRLVERHGSKGTMLSHATLELASRAMATLPHAPVAVLCDKHGGRNFYHHLLGEWFPESLVEIYAEGRDESLYRFGPPERRVEFRFRAKGERCLTTALASMASKYLRELGMRAFNAFWCDRLPGLCPTAGYPSDAKRFKTAIAAMQTALGIDDNLLWRAR